MNYTTYRNAPIPFYFFQSITQTSTSIEKDGASTWNNTAPSPSSKPSRTRHVPLWRTLKAQKPQIITIQKKSTKIRCSDMKRFILQAHYTLNRNEGKKLLSNRYSKYQLVLEILSPMYDVHLGRVNMGKHRIKLTTAAAIAIHSAPYQNRPKVRKFQRVKIAKMPKMELIKAAITKSTALFVNVSKKDRILCICVDYKRLIVVAQRDLNFISRMDECIDWIKESTVFSRIVATSEYWQAEIDYEDKDKTVLSSHRGLYRFTRIPYGLKNGTRYMSTSITCDISSRWQTALVYLRHMVTFSKTPKEHIAHVKQVLKVQQKVGVTLNLRKCSFVCNKIDCFGHVIRRWRLKISLHTTNAIKQLKKRRDVTEVRSFLGFCNVFRRFVSYSTLIVTPFN